MSFFLIAICAMLVLDLAWWIFADFLLRKAGPGRSSWRVFNGLFIAAQALGFGLIIFGRIGGVRREFSSVLMSSLYLWHLLVLPMIVAGSALTLLFLLLLFLKRKVIPKKIEAAEAETVIGEKQSRRQFLVTAAVVTPPLVNLALTGYSLSELGEFRVRKMRLAIKQLPPALNGMTIAHVSDLHVGPFTSMETMKRVAQKANDLRCDLVLLTGDLINSKTSELKPGIDFVRSLDARSGVKMIQGNHDLFIGRELFDQSVRKAGIDLLVNQTDTVQVHGHPVQLLGLQWGGLQGDMHDRTDGGIRDSMRKLLLLRETDGPFPILLAHHPHAFDPAEEAGLPLTLAGHTHGGQLMLGPNFGAGPVVFRYWSGHYQRGENQLVVSNGVGNWFPLRTWAPAEIIHLTLVSA